VRVATPRLTEAKIWFGLDEARERNARGRLYWGPQDLGDQLHLTKAEREALGITKARPRGMTAKTFAAYQRAQKTAAKKARRQAAGATAREQSDAQTKPWEALSISRRKFYRNRQAELKIGRGTNSCSAGTKYRIAATDQCTKRSDRFRVQREPPARDTASALTGLRPEPGRGRSRPVEPSRCRYRWPEFPSNATCSTGWASGDRLGRPSLPTKAVPYHPSLPEPSERRCAFGL
jgi:hypothetical protein